MNLSVGEVRALLQRAVDEKGADYVYPVSERRTIQGTPDRCVYFREDGAPSCIVGHVLHYAGVNRAQECAGAFRVAQAITWDDATLNALDEAQTVQDAGGTWGEALAAFDDCISRYAHA